MSELKYKICNNCKSQSNNVVTYFTDEVRISYIDYDIESKSLEDNKPEYYIKGYASLPTKDREEEIVLKDGIIFDEFLNYGYFNFDHRHEPPYILGVPTNAKIDNQGFYVEGKLFDTPLVKDIIELYNTCKKAGVRNLLGLSIEGKVLEKDYTNPNIIKKVLVRWVAVSPKVVNYDTTKTLEFVVKSILTKSDIVLHQDPRGEGSGTNVSLSKESVKETPVHTSYTTVDLPISGQGSLPVVINNEEDFKNYIACYLVINKGFSLEKACSKANELKSLYKRFKKH